VRATCSAQSELGPRLGVRYGWRQRGPLQRPLWHVCGPADLGHIDLTSAAAQAAPPKAGAASGAGTPGPPPRPKGRGGAGVPGGLRSLGDPRPRLAARTDDSHAAPQNSPPAAACKRRPGPPRRLVRCPVYCRIKPHAPPFQQAPANLFRSPALRLFPRRGALRMQGSTLPAPIVDGMDYQSVKY
jgi:hypothetical protein